LKSTYQNLVRVYWGIAAKLAAEIAGRLCQLGFIVLIARSVGTASFGFYSLAGFCGFLTGQLADGGLHLLTNREEVRARDSFAPSAWQAKIGAVGLLFPLSGLVAVLCSSNLEEVALFWAISYSFVIYSLAEFGFSLLRARGQLALEARLVMGNRVLLLSLGIIFAVLLEGSLGGFALAHLISSTFTMALTLRQVELKHTRLDLLNKEVGTIWKKALPLGLGLLLSLLAFRLDLPLLAQFRTKYEVGQYSAAYRLFEPVLMLPAAILAGWFPVLVRAAREPAWFYQFSRRMIGGLVALGVMVALVLALLSNWLMAWLYGLDYSNSATLLALLAGAIPFMYANYGLTHALIALGREKLNTLFFGIALVLNLGLNLILIPEWGGEGAALTTILTEAVLCGLCLLSLRRRLPENSRQSKRAKVQEIFGNVD
jgi:O-antigen/teichoic acid export membrane protein